MVGINKEEVLVEKPHLFPFKWIIKQLEYLVELESGKGGNIAELKNIKIGWIAVRELDGFEGSHLIDLLCLIDQEVKKMHQKHI